MSGGDTGYWRKCRGQNLQMEGKKQYCCCEGVNHSSSLWGKGRRGKGPIEQAGDVMRYYLQQLSM